MTTVAIPLRSIAQQIEQHESELERLRQAYQTRQTQLAELKRRRQELEAQLHQVDTEIEAVEGEEAAEAPDSTRPVPVETNSEESLTLSAFLVKVLKEVGQPMTIKQLADEVERRKFPTKSVNIYHLVQNRVQKMAKKGLLNRAKGELGYVVGKAAQDEKRRVQASPGKKIRRQKPASTKSSPHSPSNGQKPQRHSKKFYCNC